jgi:di/tricarboxylate transporter
LLAFVCFLMRGLGVLTWRQFEQEVGWTDFFVIAASLSLAQALSRSGASDWLAAGVVGAAHAVAESPWMVVGVLLAAASVVRLVIPNITGFLATTIPVAMAVGTASELNPVICGLTSRSRATPCSTIRRRAPPRSSCTSAGTSPRGRSSASVS